METAIHSMRSRPTPKQPSVKPSVKPFVVATDIYESFPVPQSVEEQTAWDMENILKELPAGAPLSRMEEAYQKYFGRYFRFVSSCEEAKHVELASVSRPKS